eukprot:CAMPEP_0176385650 /NCGR_PEP_ID=MMETSP0126-20121128/35315_1 /TAXON_ID=141414 ORGANISM="Strombidinopsis acuminatum, Strain SPMC142" /NCGR_SAMPLE_ID=MMETSP0126 /ASSEMBLY_ACC=CAM_ASM_000229 /LENGTH=94 /DNA_ID=CAMNT_0017752129 /DNA_START=992 /DNA_END=1276 /DNA_ORIENTATION=-
MYKYGGGNTGSSSAHKYMTLDRSHRSGQYEDMRKSMSHIQKLPPLLPNIKPVEYSNDYTLSKPDISKEERSKMLGDYYKRKKALDMKNSTINVV